jgi:hypothetical protein
MRCQWHCMHIATFVFAMSLGLFAQAAEPTAQDRETARRLMDDGDAKAADKNHAAASLSYEKAHALMRVPTTGLELAKSYERIGRLVEARDVALEVLRMARVAKEPEVFQRARDEAIKLAGSLAGRVASLNIEVSPVAASVKISVTVDGKLVPEAALGIGFAADPGKHVVTASAPGYRTAQSEVVAKEGDHLPIALKLEPALVSGPNCGARY